MNDRGFIKPFLLLQSRAEPTASDEEFAMFCRLAGLEEQHLKRVRLDLGEFPKLFLSNYSGVIMADGPYGMSDNYEDKPVVQRAFEPWLMGLLSEIVANDTPFLGISFGMNALIKSRGGTVGSEHAEIIGISEIMLGDDCRSDPLVFDMPEKFMAFVSHNEGTGSVPAGVVSLARSADCIQMVRIGQNVYATQFHPEVEVAGDTQLPEPVKILRRFIDRYVTEYAVDAGMASK